jgi:phosphocarrier protein FPr
MLLETAILSKFDGLVRLDARVADKSDAICQVAQLLIAAGCVDAGYEESMVRREAVANTYLGEGDAIPHGLGEDKGLVRHDGIAVLQLRDSVEWNPGQRAHLVVGIAANSDSHLAILRRLTRLLQDEARLAGLIATSDKALIIAALYYEGAPVAHRPAVQDLAETAAWIVDYPAGLHARPAAAWVEAARALPVALSIRHGADSADPRSLVSLLQLGLKAGDEVVVSAAGDGARDAVDRFLRAVAGITAREKADAERAAEKAKGAVPIRGWTPAAETVMIAGVGAGPGLAIGKVHVLASAELVVLDLPVDLVLGARNSTMRLCARGRR